MSMPASRLFDTTPSIEAVFPDCMDPITSPRRRRDAGQVFAGSVGAFAPRTPWSTMYWLSRSTTRAAVGERPVSGRDAEYLAHHESVGLDTLAGSTWVTISGTSGTLLPWDVVFCRCLERG